MDNIIIRNIKKEDIPQVVDIQILGWQTAYKGIIDDTFLNSMDRDERIEMRNKDYNQNGFIVAEYNNEILAFSRYIDNNSFSPQTPDIDCEITALYTKPNLKGKGIGTKIFNYIINEFKQLNKEKMIIWCLKENYPARKFYEKMGGTIIGEKTINFGNKDYMEVGFLYNIKDL